jgi:hypothetical protein
MILRCFDSAKLASPRIWNAAAASALAIFVQTASAQGDEKASADGRTTAADESANEDGKAFSASAGLKLRSGVQNEKDRDYTVLLSATGSMGYDFKDIGALAFYINGNKDLNNEQRWYLTDASISFGRSIPLLEAAEKDKGLNLAVDLSYGVPVSKDIIKYSNSKGDLGANLGLSYAFEGSLSGLNVSYGLSYSRYLYQYDDSNGGSILTKWALTQNYGASYTYQDYTLAANFSNISSYDFHHNKEDDAFNHVESLAYQINDAWTASLGHINDGRTYDYGGKANNVRLYDKYRSQVYVGGRYTF